MNALRFATRHPDVRRLVSAEALSGLGDGLFWVALVTELAHRNVGVWWFAAAAIARLGPRALVGTAAGALADRFDRRALLVWLDVSRALSMAAIAVVIAARGSLALVIGLVLLTYTLAAPYRPALTAAVPQVVDERELGVANALLGTVRQVLTFLGPLVGVAMLAVGSPSWAVVVNGITFLLSAALISRIGPTLNSPTSLAHVAPVATASERTFGITSEWLVVIAVFAMYLVRGAELLLHVLVAKDRLGLGASGAGLLGGAIGLGALAAVPMAARFGSTEHPAQVLLVSLIANALPLAILAITHSPAVALLALFVQGIALVAFEVVTLTVVQRLHPRHGLGRAFGRVNAASNAGRLAGVLIMLVAVGWVGLDASLIALSIALVVLVAPLTPGMIRLGRQSTSQRRILLPLVEVLAASPLFEGTSPTTLERVAERLTVRVVPAGTELIREGDEANMLFVARVGTFDVSANGRKINQMVAGDWFGEIGLIEHRRRTATVVATSEAELWCIPGADFLAALADASAPPAAMLDSVAERLARTPELS